MAKNIRKNKNLKLFFLVLGLLLAIGILVFSNYLSKTSTSTDTKAAGLNCGKFYGKRNRCIENGCNYNSAKKTCDFPSATGNTATKGKSPVKTQAGYCQNGLDCNIGWIIDGKYNPPQQPVGSYSCPQPYKGNLVVFCCPPGMRRDNVTMGPGNPGTCIKK